MQIECFLLVRCQIIDVQSRFTVLKHAFLIGFPITISKPWMLNWILVVGLETINKLCTLYMSLKPNACLSLVTILKSHKKMSNLFLCDYLTTHYSMVKCCRNVTFEEIDTEPLFLSSVLHSSQFLCHSVTYSREYYERLIRLRCHIQNDRLPI